MNDERPKPKAFATLCGRIFRDTDPQYFPSAEHRDRRIILCTEACLGAFLADPDVFCRVHRNLDKAANLSGASFDCGLRKFRSALRPGRQSD